MPARYTQRQMDQVNVRLLAATKEVRRLNAQVAQMTAGLVGERAAWAEGRAEYHRRLDDVQAQLKGARERLASRVSGFDALAMEHSKAVKETHELQRQIQRIRLLNIALMVELLAEKGVPRG